MHGGSDVWRSYINVALDTLANFGGLGDHEAVAVAVHGQPAGDEISVGCGFRDGVSVARGFDQLAAKNKLLEQRTQVAAFLSAKAEFADELFVSGRTVRQASDVGEELGFTQHQS
jgi:hypothetical protein